MQALVLDGGVLEFTVERPIPVPDPGEALIRVRLAGICSTDLELVKGYAGGFSGVLGHEFVGVVEKTGHNADEPWQDRRVVGTINLGCRRCSVCIGEGPEHCPDRTVLGIIKKDGVFADYVTLPIANLLPVPDELRDEEAVFTEPLAAALRIREQIRVRPSSRVAVVGPGRLGLLVAQVLALGGTAVTVLGRRPETLDLPAALGLATGLIDNQDDNSCDLVVEATGNEAGFAQSLRIVRPRGTLVLKSTFSGDARLNLAKLVVAEIRVVGSRCGPFAPALQLLRSSVVTRDALRTPGSGVQVLPLIEGEYALRDGPSALEHAARPGVRKILLRPD